MKRKVFLIIAVLFASLLIVAVEPVEAALPPEAYSKTKYDPRDDVILFRTGGDFKSEDHPNVDVLKMTSSYIDNPLIDEIELKMTVEGTIQNSESYKYIFACDIDGDIYIFVAWQQGMPIGVKLGESNPINPAYISASGAGTDTLTITVDITAIDSHDQRFDFTGGAVYSVGDYERYLDIAPDKLILITEPSDKSTLSGGITVKGVIRETMDNKPGNDVWIRIDGADVDIPDSDPWESWEYNTGSLSDGTHTIRAWIEGSGVANAEDEITVEVNSNTGSYLFFSEPEVRKPHIGDYLVYQALGDADINGIEIPLTTDMWMKVNGIETVKVDSSNYDVFNITTYGEGGQDLGYVWFSNEMNKTTFRDTETLETVKERAIVTNKATLRDTTTTDTTSTYDPPYETHHDFNVKEGWNYKWTLPTITKHSESTTTVGGSTSSNPPYNEYLDYTGECLYYLPSWTVKGHNYNDIYVIRSYLENPGVSIVEYYSPEFGVPVQMDTYDASRNLLISLGMDYSDSTFIPFSLEITDVRFDPSDPKVNTDCKIIVSLAPIGDDDAENLMVVVNDGSRQVGEKAVSSISAGSTEDVSFTWKPKSEGNHNIKVTVSYAGTDILEETVSVSVGPEPEDGGSDMFFVLILIVVIVAIVVVLAVVLMKRKKPAAEAPPSEAAPEVEAEAAAEAAPAAAPVAAAPVTVATEGEVQPAAAAAPAPAEAQLITENIQCPSCQNSFSVQYESKPVRVKCPTCGTEGVLN